MSGFLNILIGLITSLRFGGLTHAYAFPLLAPLMAAVSGINWTDASFAPWLGCTRISPGCDGCGLNLYGGFGVKRFSLS
jgi:hypothetical protein